MWDALLDNLPLKRKFTFIKSKTNFKKKRREKGMDLGFWEDGTDILFPMLYTKYN